MSLALLIIGFAILILGAEWLIKGASALAKKLSISEIVIGLTIVAFGTSSPEMAVNIFASIQNKNDIIFGNIIGSNLFNILLNLGISGLLFPIIVKKNTVLKEIPFSFLAALALLLLVNDYPNNPVLSRNDGIILLLFFAIFMTYLFSIAKSESIDNLQVKQYASVLSILLVLAGLALLFAGGKLCITGAVGLANFFGLSEKFIASTVMATGTAMPELITSLVAAYRKKSDIAIGNIIGSNIFNILAILGISSVIRPISYNLAFNVDICILLAFTIFLSVTMFFGKKHQLRRWQAAILLLGYIAYVTYLSLHK
jgi:cation:H+ antiporter